MKPRNVTMWNRLQHPILMLAVIAATSSACERSRLPASPSGNPIVGVYTLTLSVGSECAVIPEVARNRTYSARIDSTGLQQSYTVTLSDATFLTDNCGASSGLGCNQFLASQDGDEIEFQLIANSERLDNEFAGNGGAIVEQIVPGTSLGVYGTGHGRLDGQTIQATLEGRLGYCPSSDPAHPSSCRGSGAVQCYTSNLQLTFTRR